ncbi:MAG TPA: 3-phosphoserine/phosphohydroxythreonine transaminase [Polyangiales bacterium]
MTHRVINFNAGPGALPLSALERAQCELLDFEATGMSIMEHSHRGEDYQRVHFEALSLIAELLAVPDTHQVLLLPGGARMQFAMLPMNLRTDRHAGDYVITGLWAKVAYEEARTVGSPSIACDVGVDGQYDRVPNQAELRLSSDAPYVHITSNNTLYGTQFQSYPDTGAIPLVADMTSDLLWRPLDVAKFGAIYAGAQKNIGPAGVSVVVMRNDLIERGRRDIPMFFRYVAHAHENSLYNTAPTFPIYMVRNVLQWLKELGGLAAIEQRNRVKAARLYEVIDASDGFYRSAIEKDSRSIMNVVFRLSSDTLDQRFIRAAHAAGMVGLKGHRLVGGIRASIYNAVSVESVETLAQFMQHFQRANG